MDYVGKIKAKYPYLEYNDIDDILEISKEILLNTLYPFDNTITEIPPRKEMWIYRCMIEVIERNGMTSALAYRENGIQINFDRTQVSQGLINELIPESGVY